VLDEFVDEFVEAVQEVFPNCCFHFEDPPVHLGGQTLLPSQANNLYIFPAVGLAIYLTRPKRATNEMFIEAAHAVADQVSPIRDFGGQI
jgi:malic enzyme